MLTKLKQICTFVSPGKMLLIGLCNNLAFYCSAYTVNFAMYRVFYLTGAFNNLICRLADKSPVVDWIPNARQVVGATIGLFGAGALKWEIEELLTHAGGTKWRNSGYVIATLYVRGIIGFMIDKWYHFLFGTDTSYIAEADWNRLFSKISHKFMNCVANGFFMTLSCPQVQSVLSLFLPENLAHFLAQGVSARIGIDLLSSSEEISTSWLTIPGSMCLLAEGYLISMAVSNVSIDPTTTPNELVVAYFIVGTIQHAIVYFSDELKKYVNMRMQEIHQHVG